MDTGSDRCRQVLAGVTCGRHQVAYMSGGSDQISGPLAAGGKFVMDKGLSFIKWPHITYILVPGVLIARDNRLLQGKSIVLYCIAE